MAYAQDTITAVNAANDLVTVLDGLLIEAGWTVVETLTPSGNFRNRVYQSSGASNLCGYTWYLLVSWTTIGTENYVHVLGAEAYVSGTHIATGLCGAPFSNWGSSTPASYKTNRPTTGYYSNTTRNMATFTTSPTIQTISTLEGSSSSQYNNGNPGFQTLIPSSAFAYWASVTLDHVAIWTTVNTNAQHGIVSTLILDDDYEANALYNHTPLVGWYGGPSGNGRHLQMSSSLLGLNPTTTEYVATGVTFSQVYGAKLPALADAYFEDAYAWMPYVYLNYMTQGSANVVPLGGQLAGQMVVGRVPDFFLVWGGTIGDTVTIDAATYVLSDPLLTSWSTDLRPTAAVLVEA